MQINKVADLIKAGGLVIFPTETVYGLGASVFIDSALKKILKIKGRPSKKGFIAHIAKISDIDKFAKNIPIEARKLARRYWPGPLTLVLKARASVSKLITGGGDTVAIRMPNHKSALNLIKLTGPIVGTSANIHMQKPPISIKDISPRVLSKVDCVIDGGKAKDGKPSTIIDFTKKPFAVLRQGSVEVK